VLQSALRQLLLPQLLLSCLAESRNFGNSLSSPNNVPKKHLDALMQNLDVLMRLWRAKLKP